MANPKCGTCRFFQKNDLPGSGWCHHPQRKVSSDVKILVRRSELACRDDWSRSLWQPATGEPSGHVGATQPATSGPLLPASAASLRAVLNRDLTMAAAAGEDVLLSEGRIVSERSEHWEAPARTFPAGNFDPRTAIFKAREAYREKIRANAIAARQATDAVAGGTEPGDGEQTLEETAATARPADDFPLGAARVAVASAAQPESAAVPPLEPSWPSTSHSSTRDLSGGMSDPTGVESRQLRADENSMLPAPPDVCLPEAQDVEVQTDVAAVIETQPSAVRVDLPLWFRDDLPRICRACRDYRPGGEGQRGWCANKWAFTNRQLVQEDDVTPCHSTIGDWWAPVDDVWMVAADISAHGRPTPFLDRLIGAETGQRRRS